MVRFGGQVHPHTFWSFAPYSPGAFRKRLRLVLRDPGMTLLIAEADGQITGAMIAQVDELAWSRTRFATDILFLAERGGRELMEEFKRWAVSLGAKVFLSGVTEKGRARAKDRWYQSMGFERVGSMYFLGESQCPE